MIRSIEENLTRQNKAMRLLLELLEEEFAALRKREPQTVSRVDLSIQELMRQIAAERFSLKAEIKQLNPDAARVRDVLDSMDGPGRRTVDGLLAALDKAEQDCAVKADKNRHLSLGLFEQSKSLLKFLHNEIQPKSDKSYSARGRYAAHSPQAALLSGRL
ncbi:MAG: flagellar export chaperone FlgN [Desulfovibrionaceae bacterium]|nr:flagellar export chaperone FlgN [Desulfovibrionaceae bacterium]MDD4951240.1 flagellar export chaperone FlgN [Desulfovibrionaceae bacterium]